jgi:electron transport complex protein RnfC
MPPSDANIDTLILNGAECEPYLTADHRLMLENSEAVIDGIRIVRKTLPNISRVFIGIELNKRNAIREMERAARGEADVSVVRLQVKYPQGAEKQMIYAITRRVVPAGGLPSAVGVVVMNVGTAAAVAEAVRTGMPTLTRIVTVSGDAVREPANLRVRIGSTFADCLTACGGLTGSVFKLSQAAR